LKALAKIGTTVSVLKALQYLKSGDTQQVEDMLNDLEARANTQESRIGSDGQIEV
jgi:hypothetical protein